MIRQVCFSSYFFQYTSTIKLFRFVDFLTSMFFTQNEEIIYSGIFDENKNIQNFSEANWGKYPSISVDSVRKIQFSNEKNQWI